MTEDNWVVEVVLNCATQTYTVERVVLNDRTVFDPLDQYVLVKAVDEIGAFNEAAKTLSRLGFRVGN